MSQSEKGTYCPVDRYWRLDQQEILKRRKRHYEELLQAVHSSYHGKDKLLIAKPRSGKSLIF